MKINMNHILKMKNIKKMLKINMNHILKMKNIKKNVEKEKKPVENDQKERRKSYGSKNRGVSIGDVTYAPTKTSTKTDNSRRTKTKSVSNRNSLNFNFGGSGSSGGGSSSGLGSGIMGSSMGYGGGTSGYGYMQPTQLPTYGLSSQQINIGDTSEKHKEHSNLDHEEEDKDYKEDNHEESVIDKGDYESDSSGNTQKSSSSKIENNNNIFGDLDFDEWANNIPDSF